MFALIGLGRLAGSKIVHLSASFSIALESDATVPPRCMATPISHMLHLDEEPRW